MLLVAKVAAAPMVVASIKPLLHIAAAITEGVSLPVLAVSENQDPHHLSLKPSERQSLQDAALFLWIGPSLELPLERLVPQLPGKVVSAQALSTIGLLDGEAAHAGHGHGDHSSVDGHLWLDTRNAAAIATALAAELATLDPSHAERYAANLARFEVLLQATEMQLEQLLAPLRTQPWAVEHHAFRYLEAQFGLSPALQLRGSDNNAAGVRSARRFANAIAAGNLQCIVAEPQVAATQLRSLLGNPQLHVAQADILGRDLLPGAASYAQLMTRLAEVIVACGGAAQHADSSQGISHE